LGHSGVYVYVPQETFAPSPDPLRLKLKNDQLKIQVVEGRIHDIRTSYEVQKRPWKKYLPWETAGEGGKEGEAKEADEPLSHKWRKGYIEKWAPIRPGDPIRKSDLESYVEFLERRPGRSVAAVVQKAQGTGTARELAALNGGDVDVELRVRDFDPLTFYIESSNTGTVSTIELRYRFGLVHNDLTGRGDILSLDVSPGAELDFLPANYSMFASYEAPLWNPRWTGRTLVAYSEFESEDLLGPNTAFVGKGLVLSGELKYKLWEANNWSLDIYDVLDYQRSEVETPFGFTTILKLADIGVGTRLGRTKDCKIPLTENVACGWKPSLDLKFAYNLTELLDLSTEDDFKESRARTEPGYYFFRILANQRFTFDFADTGKPDEKEQEKKEEEGPKGESPLAERERLRERLPPGKWLSIDQQAGLHYSPDRLPSAKQMFIGGLNSVRGYPNSVLGGDRGFFLASELRVDVSRMLEGRSTSESKQWWKNFGVELVPFLIDVGMVRTNAAASGEEESTWIAGTGGGGRLYYKDILSARFNGGIALMDTGDDEDATRSGNKEFHFDLALHF
jgi:hemolysin activation/secretion protein